MISINNDNKNNNKFINIFAFRQTNKIYNPVAMVWCPSDLIVIYFLFFIPLHLFFPKKKKRPNYVIYLLRLCFFFKEKQFFIAPYVYILILKEILFFLIFRFCSTATRIVYLFINFFFILFR